jgi:sphingomyelin phosphodiesterase 2
VPDRVTIASLNVRGIPLRGTCRALRYRAIGRAFEASATGIVCFQEVHTWYHLRALASHMPSFRYIARAGTSAAPAGGLAILSRLPLTARTYRRLAAGPARGLPARTRLFTAWAGALTVRVPDAGMHLINTHPTANRDGDWSPGSRFGPLQEAQLAAVGAAVQDAQEPVIVCGDFNTARDSDLFTRFLAQTGLSDTSGGTCPPTFRASYLPAGATTRCIDFILTAGPVKTEKTGILCTGTIPTPRGPMPVSDHLGLSATVCVSRPTARTLNAAGSGMRSPLGRRRRRTRTPGLALHPVAGRCCLQVTPRCD